MVTRFLPKAVSRATAGLALLVVPTALSLVSAGPAAMVAQASSESGCLKCHAGIEPMHPEAELGCVDCHGGDAEALLKAKAHIARPSSVNSQDERVAPEDRNLAWRRFKNPMDLRVADKTCGNCHASEVERVRTSLHGTTAGHLSDGYYETGGFDERGSRWSMFAVKGAPEPGGEVKRLRQVPAFRPRKGDGGLSAHYGDLARKECMQCHLYSAGNAVRGRMGFDGDYRGEGCAACHIEYALDGLTESVDPTVPRVEPGHMRKHVMTAAPTTQTCTSCHYGDASIGLHFRGLSQLPPDTPGGPDIPGTTDSQLNRTFYLNDPAIVPPDVHHERGMHCIDCHTAGDVMGDGRLHGQMEYAVEASCEGCHGTFVEASTLMTERGTPLTNLRWDGDRVVLTSKVDGKDHTVPQAAHVLDEKRPEYNARAAAAMTERHAGIECYTCHAGWNANFLGFHFSRNASLSQLDLLSGKRTPGRVTTQEKVFATWKSFYAGRNETGRIAPYLTGFSTMGSVWDEDGKLVLDQAMPETAAGLSGMTMIHHQLHSVRPTARSCVECHRTSSTWGLGSPNFRLARRFAFVADKRGIEVIALDRVELLRSVALTKFVQADIVSLELDCDPLQGYARYLYAAEAGRGIHVFDVSNPLAMRRVAFIATINPRGLALSGDHLYVADGEGGLSVFNVQVPAAIERVGHVPTFDAYDVEVHWPWAYVADGAGGLAIIDIAVPIAPQFVSALDITVNARTPSQATDVAALFQYSRPQADENGPLDTRSTARLLCAVMDRERGLVFVDATEPTHPKVLYPRPSDRSREQSTDRISRGIVLLSQVDPAESQGGDRTAERDYVYLITENSGNGRALVHVVDASEPDTARLKVQGNLRVGEQVGELVAADFYNPPFRQRVLFVPGATGVYLADVTTSREPTEIGILPGTRDAYAVAIEEFPLDQMTSASGKLLKDVSHPNSRWLYRAEIEGILGVSPEELGLDSPDEVFESYGLTARLHLTRFDADGSGYLEAAEYEKVGGAGSDTNGDGRLSLAELATDGGAISRGDRQEPVGDAFLLERVLPDGDLARLLDSVSPLDFDSNGDDRLDRREMRDAMFAALDLDGDGELNQDELSRHPGELRELRYNDLAAKSILAKHEKKRDGVLSLREFRLGDAEWRALDVDQDGWVRFKPGRLAFQSERGFVLPGGEWPMRRTQLMTLPPGTTLELFLQRYDEDEDGLVSAGELGLRRDLLDSLDRNGDRELDAGEISRPLPRLAREGVHTLADDLEGRWDLDGDGRVSLDELPEGVHLGVGPYFGVR